MRKDIKKKASILILLAFFSTTVFSLAPTAFNDVLIRNGLKIGGSGFAEASAALEINSFNKGLLISRLTETQRDAISSPATGLMIFNTDDAEFNYWDGDSWEGVAGVPLLTADRVPITDAAGLLTTTNALQWQPTGSILYVGAASSSSNGSIIVGGSGTGVGDITGGGGALNITGGPLTIDTTGTGSVVVQTANTTALTISGTTQAATFTQDVKADTFSVPEKTSATSPAASTIKLWYDSITSRFKSQDSSGLVLNVGSPDHINYIPNSQYERNVTGFNAYKDAAGVVPVDGTGGSPTTTIARDAIGNLRGAGSFTITKPASNTQGEGVSIDFTIDPIDARGSKPLAIKFDYKTANAYIDRDVVVFVYDGVNPPIPIFNTDSGAIRKTPTGTLLTDTFSGYMYTTSGDTTYRLIFHQVGTGTAASDITGDNLSVSPDKLFVVDTGGVKVIGSIFWPQAANCMWAATNIGPSPATPTADSDCVLPTTQLKGRALSPITKQPGIRFANVEVGDYYFKVNADIRSNTGDTCQLRVSDGTNHSNVQFAISSSTTNGNGFWHFHIPITQALGDTTFFIQMATSSGNQCQFYNGGYPSDFEITVEQSLPSTKTMFSTFENINKISRFQVQSSGTQAISATTNTKVTNWGTPSINVGGLTWASSTLTATKKMTVFVSASIQMYGNSQGGSIFLNKNGSTVARSSASQTNIAEYTLTASVILDLAQGDYLEVIGFNGGSSTISGNGGSISLFEVTDSSSYGVNGQWELVPVTTSTKTPLSTNNYHQLSGNTITLTPGTWELSAIIDFTNNGSNPGYEVLAAGFWGANGADTTSAPVTALSAVTGLTILSALPPGNQVYVGAAEPTGEKVVVPKTIVRVNQTVTIYLVTYCTTTINIANARITGYGNAERKQ